MITTMTKRLDSWNNLIIGDLLAVINFNDNAVAFNDTFLNATE